MSDVVSGRCPRPDCPAAVTLASSGQIEAGAYLWQCELGHHGPRFIGYDSWRRD